MLSFIAFARLPSCLFTTILCFSPPPKKFIMSVEETIPMSFFVPASATGILLKPHLTMVFKAFIIVDLGGIVLTSLVAKSMTLPSFISTPRNSLRKPSHPQHRKVCPSSYRTSRTSHPSLPLRNPPQRVKKTHLYLPQR